MLSGHFGLLGGFLFVTSEKFHSTELKLFKVWSLMNEPEFGQLKKRRLRDKLKLTGQNLGRVFNFRSGHLHAATFLESSVKLTNLEVKTLPKQLLVSHLLVIALPGHILDH